MAKHGKALDAALAALDVSELEELDLLLASDLPCPDSFREFVDEVRPHYQWYWHCRKLSVALERVAAGEVKRLMVFMPPRHGKSEQVSRLFSAYFLRRFPDRWVGITSYSADLSYLLSRNSRTFYQRGDVDLAQDAHAVKHWETGMGGGLWAAGVGGPITGKGMHLGIIDDPIKNAEEASSATIRAKQKDWYDSTFYTRLEPGGVIVVILTRWHQDDLAGYLLAKEETEPEHWHIVDFAARKEDGRSGYPATCTVETDERQVGDALCPERYDDKTLKTIEGQLGPYYFAALYQQRPRPRAGNLFKDEWFEVVEAAPVGETVRFWDRAATKNDGDRTAGVKVRKAKDGTIYIMDAKCGQWGPGERDRIIRNTATADGKECRQYAEQEPGASGVDAKLAFSRLLAGYSARSIPSSVDKRLRADGLAAAAESGRVKLVRGAWNKPFLDELCMFDKGDYDDQVDGASGAFNVLERHVSMSAVSPGMVMGVNEYDV